MKVITIQEVQSGMITGDHVRSKSGQIIIKSGTVLTSADIHHLECYQIPLVPIQTEEISHSLSIAPAVSISSELIAYQNTVKVNLEEKHFERTFHENSEFLEQYLNEMVLRNVPNAQETLLHEMMDLFQRTSQTVNIYDMLRCIRKIDDSTYAHSINVAMLSRMIGQWIGLSSTDIDVLTLAGLLHDIGKCQIPRAIMSKPSSLTREEYEIVKRHCINGYTILKEHPLDPRIKRAALMHHERHDGSGYPVGFLGDDIDEFSEIISIADVYDAMTSNRCYREALCPFEVISTFEKEGFHKYKSQYLATFLSHVVDTYMNHRIMLNDGSYGKIVLKNKQHLACPTVYSDERRFIDLSQHPDLFIQAIV